VEVEVIDDADESVKQQASGRCKNPLLKRGQEGINVHGWHSCPLWGQEYMRRRINADHFHFGTAVAAVPDLTAEVLVLRRQLSQYVWKLTIC
jgi:hypothetical protein